MFAYRIIYLFLNFYREDSSVYSYHLLLKFWINLSTVYTLTCIYYTLQFIQSTYYIFFLGRGTVCPHFVVLSTIGSIAFFYYNIACNYHVGWCDITVQFAAFTPYILQFFVCLLEKHILQPILLYWSIAIFDSNIAFNYHVGWCDITIQFAAFTPYILPFFVCLFEKHILQPILLWYWSIAFFYSNIVCHCHVGWCDITSIPTFVIIL